MSGDVFEFVADQAGHRILRRLPGFEFTPMLLGKITSFIVQPPTRGWAVFAFMFPLLTPEGDLAADDESQLAAEALRVTQLAIEEGRAGDGDEVTYAWRDGAWQEVPNPSWWVSTRSWRPDSRT